MPTISTSGKYCTAARNTIRPMRPNPLMPTLIVMLRISSILRAADGAPSSNHFLYGSRDVFAGEAKIFEQFTSRRRLAEAVYSDDSTGRVVDGAHVFAPIIADPRLHRNPWNSRRQYRSPISAILHIEHRCARH